MLSLSKSELSLVQLFLLTSVLIGAQVYLDPNACCFLPPKLSLSTSIVMGNLLVVPPILGADPLP